MWDFKDQFKAQGFKSQTAGTLSTLYDGQCQMWFCISPISTQRCQLVWHTVYRYGRHTLSHSILVFEWYRGIHHGFWHHGVKLSLFVYNKCAYYWATKLCLWLKNLAYHIESFYKFVSPLKCVRIAGIICMTCQHFPSISWMHDTLILDGG